MISIIIPSYNNLELLQKCVLSIQNQTTKAYEVWIIDNESTDGTIDYLKTLETPFHWRSEKDNGIYDAMNKGISLATKEWLYFLGADDVLYNQHVLNDIFSKSIPSQYKLILGCIKYDPKKGDKLYKPTRDGLVKPSWSMKLWIKNSVHHQGAFYRRELFISSGYELKYKVLADYAFNLNLYAKEVEVKIIEIVIAMCGVNGLSKSSGSTIFREDVQLKVDKSSVLLKPLFVLINLLKVVFKKFMIIVR